MRDVVIVAARRTAIGTFGGGLSSLSADQLGTAVIKALMEETGVAGDQINEVVLGQVLTAGVGQNPARQSAINAGIPASVPAMTINKVCGSGLKAVHMAVQAIRCGDAEMMIAGGQESMSQAPHVLPNSRNGQRMGNWSMVDTMIKDGLWDAFNDYHMGITAENIVEKYGISRDEQDELQLRPSRRPPPLARPVTSTARLSRSPFPSVRVTRSSLTAMKAPATASLPRGLANSVRPSRKTAPLPPATPHPSTMAPQP